MKTREIRAIAAGAGLALAAAASAESPPFGAQFYEAGGRPSALGAGDYNADGVPDLAWLGAETDFSAAGVSIAPGVGDGSFGARRTFEMENNSDPRFFLSGDFDGDGIHEALADRPEGNAASGMLSFYRLNAAGDAVIGEPADLGGPSAEQAVMTGLYAAGDFNGDGTDDVAFADGDETGVNLTFGFASGFDFGQTVQPGLANARDLSALGAADLDGDGEDELIYAHDDRVAVWKDGGELAVFELDGEIVSVGAGEFDGEPGLDLFAYDIQNTVQSTVYTISDPLGSAATDVFELVLFSFGGQGRPTPIDADGDGLTDLVVVFDRAMNPSSPFPSEGSAAGASRLVVRSEGAFSVVPYWRDPKVGYQPTAVVAEDFNGDGAGDLAATNAYGQDGPGIVTVLLGQGEDAFGQLDAAYESFSDFGFRGGRLLDLTGDGFPEAVVRGGYILNESGSLRLSRPEPPTPLTDSEGGEILPGRLADIDGDGDFDHVTAEPGQVRVALGDGLDFSVQPAQSVATLGEIDGFSFSPALDGEGGDDLLVIDRVDDGGEFRRDAIILEYQGGGAFTQTRYEPFGTEREPTLVDATGDGLPDLLWTRRDLTESAPSYLWENNGAGVFLESDEPFLPLPAFRTILAWHDLNGDGLPDAVAQQVEVEEGEVVPNATQVISLLQQPDSSFVAGQTLTGPAETGVHSATSLLEGSGQLSDLDGDGRDDLVVLGASSNNQGLSLYLFERRPDGFFERGRGVAQFPGRSTVGVSIADVELDGDPDLFFTGLVEDLGGGLENNAVLANAVIYNRTEGPKRSCPYDVDGDNRVGASDLGFVLTLWGAEISPQSSLAFLDDDGDGVIGSGDLGPILAAWGPCPE